MKTAILLTFMMLALLSCSQPKGETKSTFKIIVGAQALGVPLNGGAFIETEMLQGNMKKIIKLDQDNSTSIPLGEYNILFIAFAGPAQKSGTMYCGSVSKVSLLNPSATVSVTLATGNCPQPKYTEFKNKLLGVAHWDSATFDSSKWGP